MILTDKIDRMCDNMIHRRNNKTFIENFAKGTDAEVNYNSCFI